LTSLSFSSVSQERKKWFQGHQILAVDFFSDLKELGLPRTSQFLILADYVEREQNNVSYISIPTESIHPQMLDGTFWVDVVCFPPSFFFSSSSPPGCHVLVF